MKQETSPTILDFLNLKTSAHLKERQVYEKIVTGKLRSHYEKAFSKHMTQKGESIEKWSNKILIFPNISQQNDLKPNHKGGFLKDFPRIPFNHPMIVKTYRLNVSLSMKTNGLKVVYKETCISILASGISCPVSGTLLTFQPSNSLHFGSQAIEKHQTIFDKATPI